MNHQRTTSKPHEWESLLLCAAARSQQSEPTHGRPPHDVSRGTYVCYYILKGYIARHHHFISSRSHAAPPVEDERRSCVAGSASGSRGALARATRRGAGADRGKRQRVASLYARCVCEGGCAPHDERWRSPQRSRSCLSVRAAGRAGHWLHLRARPTPLRLRPVPSTYI